MRNPISILVVGGLLSIVPTAEAASAKKKISTEEAWHRCLKQVDQRVGRHTTTNDAQRTAAFKACMFSFGHGRGI